MRQLILSMAMSLDGFIERPGGEFVPPPWCDELEAYSHQVTEEAGLLVYGRGCFEMMRAFWDDPQGPAKDMTLTPKINAKPKVVFSSSLPDEPGWNGAVLRGDPASEIARLKAQPGADLMFFGGAEMAWSLMAADLIDEYRFMLSPQLYGEGKPLFGPGRPQADLRLITARPVSSGVTILIYRPA